MIIKVKVHTNSSKEKMVWNEEKYWDVYTTEKPLENKANIRIIEIVSDYFKIKKNKVWLVSGAKSKIKLVEVTVTDKNQVIE